MAKKDKNKEVKTVNNEVENQDAKIQENASNENQDATMHITTENEAPKMPEFKKLICKSSFTDKFDKKTVYEIGDVLDITDISRRNDLIVRGLAVEE